MYDILIKCNIFTDVGLTEKSLLQKVMVSEGTLIASKQHTADDVTGPITFPQLEKMSKRLQYKSSSNETFAASLSKNVTGTFKGPHPPSKIKPANTTIGAHKTTVKHCLDNAYVKPLTVIKEESERSSTTSNSPKVPPPKMLKRRQYTMYSAKSTTKNKVTKSITYNSSANTKKQPVVYIVRENSTVKQQSTTRTEEKSTHVGRRKIHETSVIRERSIVREKSIVKQKTMIR